MTHQMNQKMTNEKKSTDLSTTNGKRRIVRLLAGTLVALGVAGGGSMGLTAVAYAAPGHSASQDGSSDNTAANNTAANNTVRDRSAKAPAVSAPGLAGSALDKAQKLQRPGHPLAHLGMAAD
ncbi:MAG: hypothetical protein FGM25_14355 [Mycobacterium sp.]|nr:hypothetical protein [Mycobacterium sp.]